jgi:phosphatidate cytidylyltransferase
VLHCARQPTPDCLFLTRALTAAVLLGAFIAALFWLDRVQFAALVSAILGLGAHEWAKLIKAGRLSAVAYAAGCAGAGLLLAQAIWLAPWVCGAAGVYWLTVAPFRLAGGFRPASIGAGMAEGAVVLLPAGLAMVVLPPVQLLMVLGLIWVSDTGAYLAGRAFGRRKLAPSISPGKTWEGVAGGAIGCVIYAIIWALSDPDLRALVQGLVWMPFLAGTVLLCAAGVVGDLLESGLKRQAGAKDSGKLLPGHGGVLDRIDSATAALPVALLLMQAMGTK